MRLKVAFINTNEPVRLDICKQLVYIHFRNFKYFVITLNYLRYKVIKEVLKVIKLSLCIQSLLTYSH